MRVVRLPLEHGRLIVDLNVQRIHGNDRLRLARIMPAAGDAIAKQILRRNPQLFEDRELERAFAVVEGGDGFRSNAACTEGPVGVLGSARCSRGILAQVGVIAGVGMNSVP